MSIARENHPWDVRRAFLGVDCKMCVEMGSNYRIRMRRSGCNGYTHFVLKFRNERRTGMFENLHVFTFLTRSTTVLTIYNLASQVHPTKYKSFQACIKP
jgi:hypothetical protein